MTGDDLTLLMKVAGVCLIGAFWPQIMAFMRKHGYCAEHEAETTGWRRGVKVVGIATLIAFLAAATAFI